MNELFMVIDVESIGLHGEGFAVGYVVIGGAGTVHEERLIACPPYVAKGGADDRRWVEQNVPALPTSDYHATTLMLRLTFWKHWRHWKDQGAVLVADCPWPVEARFLMACIDDCPEDRAQHGPYPLLDVTSILYARGGDPLEKHERLPNELPEHNPLCDARQSARLLFPV